MPSDTEAKSPPPTQALSDPASIRRLAELRARTLRRLRQEVAGLPAPAPAAEHPAAQEAAPGAALASAQRVANLRAAAMERLRESLASRHDDAVSSIARAATSEVPSAASPQPERDPSSSSLEPQAFARESDLIGFGDQADTPIERPAGAIAFDRPPLVSVVLVTYRHEKFIQAAVRSLMAQTYAPLDIIILDDASPDATAAVAAAELARTSGQRLIRFCRNPRNLGFFANTRKGLSMAQGDFVIVFCGDDVMLPNMVEKMVETWRRHDVSLVTANVAYIDADGSDLHRFHTDPTGSYDDTFETLARDGANSVCFGAAMGFERDLYLEFGYPPDYLTAEDIMLPFYAYLAKGARYIPEPLMQYRVHADNDSLDIKRDRGSAIDKLLIELEMYSVHVVHAVEMTNELERRREADPARFGDIAGRILPLLAVQRGQMAAKLAATRVKLAKFGLTRLLVQNPVSEPVLALSEAVQ